MATDDLRQRLFTIQLRRRSEHSAVTRESFQKNLSSGGRFGSDVAAGKRLRSGTDEKMKAGRHIRLAGTQLH